METKKYNGWTNYETWAVALWIGNDEGSDRAAADHAEEAWGEAADRSETYLSPEEWVGRQVGERLKDEHEDANPCRERCDVFSDLMTAALSEVNWDEIGQHYAADNKPEDYKETAEAEQEV